MKLLKNPIFWGFVLFLGGIIIGAIGWDKDESTIAKRTIGSVPLIVTGITMIVAGLVIFYTTKGKGK